MEFCPIKRYSFL